MRNAAIVLLLTFLALPLTAQDPPATAKALASHDRSNDRELEDTQRAVDDALWYFKLGDVANVDKYEIASSKPRREKNATDQNAGNAIIFPVYVFSPKNVKGVSDLVQRMGYKGDEYRKLFEDGGRSWSFSRGT